MKILVTGASSFLGTHLTEELVGRGYVVRGMVRDLRKANYLRSLGVEVVYGDLTKHETLPQVVKGVDTEMYQLVNVEGTRALAQAALKSGVRRFIYCSSTEAIGPVRDPPGDENTPPNP